MIEFDKQFEIQGSSVPHVVKIRADRLGVKASCDCAAGIHNQLCKHVIQCFEDDEVKAALDEWGLTEVYADYLKRKSELEQTKQKVKTLEKATSRLAMYENHLDLLKKVETLKKETHGYKKKFERLLFGD